VNGEARLTARIAKIVREALERGVTVEIDGLGTFVPASHGTRFIAQTMPRIFIAYVEEDLPIVRKLDRALARNGFHPWLDKNKLMPGQNWPRAIEIAIQTSDYFLACFSRKASSKRGAFHSELRYALDCAARVPLDEIFLIPVRLDACDVPAEVAAQIQYVDLFPDWRFGLERVLNVIGEQEQRRCGQGLPLAG
jgi:hypothetical protein